MRISKTVNGVKYTYEYINGMLVYETRGEAKFWYSYDANGTLYNVKYTLTDDSTTYSYFYTHNSRGDIEGIYSGSGVLTAHYEYDAWGNVLEVTDKNGNAITSTTHIGNLNPFRYRGYYYGTESGFYYLMSRYYDPVTHRFINADGYFQAGGDVLDSNASAYCRNNPISFVDPTGTKCSEHDPYYKPNCYTCNPEYRHFINDNLDWYNKITGENVASIGFDGTVHYKEVFEYDFNDTEAKVLRTIGIFIESFSISADVGLGIGVASKGLINFSALSKAVLCAEVSRNGFDAGNYCGNVCSVGVAGQSSIWDFETAGYHSFLSGCDTAEVGPSGVVSIGCSAYTLVGGSFEVSFDYNYFGNEFSKLWW